MKKIILLLITLVVFSSCTSDNENNITSSSSLKIIITNTSEENTLQTLEYFFNTEGKVIKETFINTTNPEYNSVSTFQYDNLGRVSKEIRNNEIVTTVVWNGSTATLLGNNTNGNPSISYTFLNEKVIESNFMGTIHKYNYDGNDNVISEEQADSVFVEYLNYDTTLLNPMYLIKSIGVLRMSSNPYFKNFYQTKKAYPYQGDDYFFPLTYFQFQKTVSNDNKIIKITNNENFYTSKFEYN